MGIQKQQYHFSTVYFTGLALTLLISCIYLMYVGKTAAFLSLHDYHPFWLNIFFINYTFIGDGVFALSLMALLFFYYKHKKQSLVLVSSFLLSGLVVQLIKNFVLAPGPKLFFENGQYLFFTDEVTRTGNAVFPSAHTATAFAMATTFVLIYKIKKWQLPILLAAILVAYSRIYLAQHFLMDLIVGAVIGSLSGVLAVYLVQQRKRIKTALKQMHLLPKNVHPTNSPSPVQPV